MSAHRSKPATVAVTAGRPEPVNGAPVNPPIVLSSTFASSGTPEPGIPFYARADNPGWHPLEDAVAALEGASERGVLFGSGMAAIAATLALVPTGTAVVAPAAAYNTTLSLLAELAAAAAITVRTVDIADTAEVINAIHGHGSPAAMVWVESPTNPMLDLADIAAIARAARDVGALVVVDNTLATPLAQRPLSLGADVVVHSVTKYLAGHSDVLLGMALTSSPQIADRLRARRTLGGAIASPVDAWLALRGLRTLAVRVERAWANACVIAERLADHPRVSWVRHPSLADSGPLASSQMSGPGAIISFGLADPSAAAADEVINRLQLWVPATSLGGVESTVERRRRHANEPVLVPEGLIRLSLGIEDIDDLWADLSWALGD